MRREEIKKSIEKVLQAADSAELEKIAEMFNSDKKEVDTKFVIQRFAEVNNKCKNFDDTDKQIFGAFGLQKINEAEFWSNFISKERISPSTFFPTYSAYRSLKEAAENFLPLLDRSSDQVTEEIEGFHVDGSKEPVRVSRLKIFVRDSSTNHITAKQLASILSDVVSLYETVVQLYSLDHVDLTVSSIDSGSDKSFDFVGIATAVEKLSSFILESWDRIRFNKEHKIDQSFKSVSAGIDLLEKISKSVESNSISQQEGENLKRKVSKNMDSLLKNGVYTDTVENNNPIKPSQLSFERRLLITHQPARDNEPVKTEVNQRESNPGSDTANSPQPTSRRIRRPRRNK